MDPKIKFKNQLSGNKCISDSAESDFLIDILGDKLEEAVLLFRGTRDGWDLSDFHAHCDDKPNTVSLFKVKNGPCIGGFTRVPWSMKRKFAKDNQAFLFNLTH